LSRAPLNAAHAVDNAREELLALMETKLSLVSQMIDFGATNLPLGTSDKSLPRNHASNRTN